MGIKRLNLLIVESSAVDAAQIQHVLQEGGLHFDCLLAATINALNEALENKTWDVILADYNFPEFNAREMLSVMGTHGMNVPFIVLSRHVGEEAAAALMEMGAHDYVMKTNMARLVPAIQRSLREVKNFQRFNQAQAALQKSEARFRALTSNLPSVVFQCLLIHTGEISFPYVSESAVTLLGLEPSILMANPSLFPELILLEDKKAFDQLMATSVKHLTVWNWEGRIQAKGDADIKWISLRATPRRTASGATLWDGIMINISRNKLAESEIARSREQLAELSSYLQKAKEHERAHIAREIHDDIGGTLTAIKCELQPCLDGTVRLPVFYQKKAKSIEGLVDQVIDSTRRISLDLRPGILDCGIVAAIRWQAREFSGRTRIPCQVSCDSEDILLDSDLSVAVFRIFQETLTNVSKHANAALVRVKLAEMDGLMSLEVTDNGRGVKQSDIKKRDSFGIRGMRERCQQLKGNFDISGLPGKGTKVTLCIPVGEIKGYAAQVVDSGNILEDLPSSTEKRGMQTKVS